LAGWTCLQECAHIILLKELLTIDQDERNVLQNQSLALLDMTFNLIALLEENLNDLKLSIRIFQFGHNFIKEVVAKDTCALTFYGQKICVPAQAILCAEVFRLDLCNLGKQESCIGVHQLNTLLLQGKRLRASTMKEFHDAILRLFLAEIADSFIHKVLTRRAQRVATPVMDMNFTRDNWSLVGAKISEVNCVKINRIKLFLLRSTGVCSSGGGDGDEQDE